MSSNKFHDRLSTSIKVVNIPPSMSKQPIIQHLQQAGDIVDFTAHDDYLIITYKSEDQRTNSLKLSGYHFTDNYDLQIEPVADNNEDMDKTKDKTEEFDNDFEVINDVDDDAKPMEVQIEDIKEADEEKPEVKQEEIYEEIAPIKSEEAKEEVNPEPEQNEEAKVAEEPFQEINEETIAAERRSEEKLAHSDQAQKHFTTRCLLVILGGWAILLFMQKFY